MNSLSDEEIYREIGKVVKPFNRLECFECAQAVLSWLIHNQVAGTLLRLRTKYRDEFIMSSRWEQSGGTQSVSANGIHYGVEVHDRVFDNLSFDGLPRQAWLDDFACRRGTFELEELEQV